MLYCGTKNKNHKENSFCPFQLSLLLSKNSTRLVKGKKREYAASTGHVVLTSFDLIVLFYKHTDPQQ